MVTTRQKMKKSASSMTSPSNSTSSIGSSNTTTDVLQDESREMGQQRHKKKKLTSSLPTSGQSRTMDQNLSGKMSTSVYPSAPFYPFQQPGMFYYPPFMLVPAPTENVQSASAGESPDSLNSNSNSSSPESMNESSSNTDTASEDGAEWSPTHGMILHTAVGAYASDLNPKENAEGEIDIEKLDWSLIAQHFPGHSALSCYQYWKSLNPETVLVKTASGILYKQPNFQVQTPCLVGSFSNGSGSIGRSGSDTENLRRDVISNRIFSTEERRSLKRKKVKEPWTKEEETKIDDLQLQLGNKWTKIAELLGTGRTGNDVKNYWHSVKDKVVEKRYKDKLQQNES